MFKSKPILMSLSFLTVASLLLAACAAPTQTQEVPVTSVVTQIVPVTETPQPGVIPASGLIACKETPAAIAGGESGNSSVERSDSGCCGCRGKGQHATRERATVRGHGAIKSYYASTNVRVFCEPGKDIVLHKRPGL